MSGDHVLPERIRGADPDFSSCDDEPGEVVVRYTIDESGDVTSVAVAKAPSDCMSEAAASAVRLWKFCPGEVRRQPVIEQASVRFTVKGRR